MRDTRHWNPRYARARLADMAYQRRLPDQPWLTPHANLALDSLLKPTDRGLEFGSGRSTAWFAARLEHITSVEHNEEWLETVKAQLRNISNVTYLHRPSTEDETRPDAYAAVADEFDDASLDFVLVDGMQRGLCTQGAVRVLRPGGLLAIDNVNWFLPSKSRTPNARSMADGPATDIWREVAASIEDWRVLWTTNNVSDTAIYFKPAS